MSRYYSDNPERDAERYQQDLEDRPCLHCVMCGESLYNGDEYFLINDEPFCEDCMEDCFKRQVEIDEQ